MELIDYLGLSNIFTSCWLLYSDFWMISIPLHFYYGIFDVNFCRQLWVLIFRFSVAVIVVHKNNTFHVDRWNMRINLCIGVCVFVVSPSSTMVYSKTIKPSSTFRELVMYTCITTFSKNMYDACTTLALIHILIHLYLS